MDSTSVSLLRRLRHEGQNDAWSRFVDLYAPLIFHWGRTQGIGDADASDLVQDVMKTLVTELPKFKYDPKKRFRGWLRTITINKARDFWRREASRPQIASDQVDGTIDSSLDLFEETEYQAFLVSRALHLMQDEFQTQTWQACWKHVAECRKAKDVAKELGMTPNAVHIAKCRVIRRLREELDGLID